MSQNDDLISRRAAISLPVKPKEDRYFQTHNLDDAYDDGWYGLQRCIEKMPSAQPEYEPVKAEDFAKTMSKNTLYSFMAWYGYALALMKEQGFVICKKTM